MAAAVELRPKTDEPIPDEETAMSTFRELLNQKDAEAEPYTVHFGIWQSRRVWPYGSTRRTQAEATAKQQVVSSNENILSLSAAPPQHLHPWHRRQCHSI